jgi:hypothetical protein
MATSFVLSSSRAGIGSVVTTQDNASRTVMFAELGAVTQNATVPPPSATTDVRAVIMA